MYNSCLGRKICSNRRKRDSREAWSYIGMSFGRDSAIHEAVHVLDNRDIALSTGRQVVA